MAHNILILGASYGSLLGTKLLMAGHNVTLVCREATAKLINEQGTEVRIRLKGEDAHRSFRSLELPGRLDAQTPENVAVGAYPSCYLFAELHADEVQQSESAQERVSYAAGHVWLNVGLSDPILSIATGPIGKTLALTHG